jgi:multidrug efflux pump subunit AcrA (membrane-fusion protein)
LGAVFCQGNGEEGGGNGGEGGGEGEGGGWAFFRAVDGVARLTPVETGARNGLAVEITSGLGPADRVVLYPADRVQDGTEIEER